MSNWIELKDSQLPRKGELIVVKNDSMPKEKQVYPHLVLVKKSLEWVQYDDDCCIVSIHGITHWKLIDSPY